MLPAEPPELPACVGSVGAHQPRGGDPRRVLVAGVGARGGDGRAGGHRRPRAAGKGTAAAGLCQLRPARLRYACFA